MPRIVDPAHFRNLNRLSCGLSVEMLRSGVNFVYQTLDTIDKTLIQAGSGRMSSLVELANLSSIVGNLLATGIVQSSQGIFTRAGAHKYQDLRAAHVNAQNIEIKMALEKNKPKGHLPKAGHYLTCRYVLGDPAGMCEIGNRGAVVWIWELRFGHLELQDFNISNTKGDSGKTAVVNKVGMDKLAIMYLNPPACPFSQRSKYYKANLKLP